jgi:hypothetical protein
MIECRNKEIVCDNYGSLRASTQRKADSMPEQGLHVRRFAQSTGHAFSEREASNAAVSTTTDSARNSRMGKLIAEQE